MEKDELRDSIIDLLLNKAAMKQDIADYGEEVLAQFKKAAAEELDAFREKVNDSRVRLKIEDKGKHEFVVYIGSDILVFQLHRNVFRLPDGDPLWETDYLKSNGANGYFGMINIYNFLAESYIQNRLNDRGYLIGRVFVNHDRHCLVEGKGTLDQFVSTTLESELTPDLMHLIIQGAMLFAINFDLMTPPYDLVKEVSVMQVMQMSSELQMATGKRLGFKFSADDQNIF